MTRTKSGSNSRFTVIDNVAGQEWDINPRQYLTGRQYRKMSAETDLVISFAHYLQDLWRAKGFEDVTIKAQINTKLNGRERQLLIEPELDLTRVKRTFLKDEISTKLKPRE